MYQGAYSRGVIWRTTSRYGSVHNKNAEWGAFLRGEFESTCIARRVDAFEGGKQRYQWIAVL